MLRRLLRRTGPPYLRRSARPPSRALEPQQLSIRELGMQPSKLLGTMAFSLVPRSQATYMPAVIDDTDPIAPADRERGLPSAARGDIRTPHDG